MAKRAGTFSRNSALHGLYMAGCKGFSRAGARRQAGKRGKRPQRPSQCGSSAASGAKAYEQAKGTKGDAAAGNPYPKPQNRHRAESAR